MPKALLRLTALSLAAALIVDPAFASGIATKPLSRTSAGQADFAAEALSGRSCETPRPGSLTGKTSADQAWTLAHMPLPSAESRRRLMAAPVVDRNGRLVRRSKTPARSYATLTFRSRPGFPDGWVPGDGTNMDPGFAQQLANLIRHGIELHLRDAPHPELALRQIFQTYPTIRLEIAANSFEEEAFFSPSRRGQRFATVVLIPSLFSPGRQANLEGAMYEFAGWLVNGPNGLQHRV